MLTSPVRYRNLVLVASVASAVALTACGSSAAKSATTGSPAASAPHSAPDSARASSAASASAPAPVVRSSSVASSAPSSGGAARWTGAGRVQAGLGHLRRRRPRLGARYRSLFGRTLHIGRPDPRRRPVLARHPGPEGPDRLGHRLLHRRAGDDHPLRRPVQRLDCRQHASTQPTTAARPGIRSRSDPSGGEVNAIGTSAGRVYAARLSCPAQFTAPACQQSTTVYSRQRDQRQLERRVRPR